MGNFRGLGTDDCSRSMVTLDVRHMLSAISISAAILWMPHVAIIRNRK